MTLTETHAGGRRQVRRPNRQPPAALALNNKNGGRRRSEAGAGQDEAGPEHGVQRKM
jgi:hypothetical protein